MTNSDDHGLAKRPLGSTGLAVSVIGLGTVKLGRNQGVKYPRAFDIPDDRQAANLLAVAAELGINLLDTAPAYGNSEERLGKLLAGQRERWLICTKVGEEFCGGESRYDFSPRHTRLSIERSLKRLGTEYLDMVLVHSDGNDLDIINKMGTLETLADLKREGKLRACGMSTKTVAGGLLAAEKSDCVMVTWNLHCSDDLPVIDYCHRHHKGVLIKKALASGHIAAAATLPARKNGNKPQPQGARDAAVAASLRMILHHPGVSSAIVGTLDPDHLRANVLSATSITSF
ncbi:MAG: aldo/keto reductase [Porticoccaceae bacterium]|nr:aldo/keto reductase [Porticoccaceae bacterium]